MNGRLYAFRNRRCVVVGRRFAGDSIQMHWVLGRLVRLNMARDLRLLNFVTRGRAVDRCLPRSWLFALGTIIKQSKCATNFGNNDESGKHGHRSEKHANQGNLVSTRPRFRHESNYIASSTRRLDNNVSARQSAQRPQLTGVDPLAHEVLILRCSRRGSTSGSAPR